MPLYQQAGLTLQRGVAAPEDVVRALQLDLRALGYLRAGIDGVFGPGTEQAVRALQYDLLNNNGQGSDANAPVAMTAYNQTAAGPAVQVVDGVFTQAMADCLVAVLADPLVPRLPSSDTPADANAQVMAVLRAQPGTLVPTPFFLAMLQQESGGRHYELPLGGDTDSFIVLGQDHNGPPDCITSRGYGIGQYTLFHHPPSLLEVQDFMDDPRRNVLKGQQELRAKFDGFVLGPADRADDRVAEHPLLPLRICRYGITDPRYLNDCRNCALQAPKVSITTGTPFFSGSADSYAPTSYYASADYTGVPQRAAFACDWPYAVRRYNGSGVNSYHYQTRVLLNLVSQPAA